MSQNMEKLALVQNDSSDERPTALLPLPKPIEHCGLLPIIHRPTLQHKENQGLEFKSHGRIKQSCVDMPSLKNIFKEEANLDKKKTKQHRDLNRFRLAKQELSREVTSGKELFNGRHDGGVRRITEDSEQSKGSLQLSKELAKGRSFLCKISRDFESKLEDSKYKNMSRERLQAIF